MSARGSRLAAVAGHRAVVLGLLVIAAPAQERMATAGRVLDASGKAVVGAMVTFVGAVHPLLDRFEPADFAEVEADEKGRFVVKLLAHGTYSAWATGPEDATGHRFVSRLRDVEPGTGFEVSLLDKRVVSRLTVAGMDAWQHLGPLRFEVGVGTPVVHRRGLGLADGTCVLPSRPRGVWWLGFVVDREDRVLWARQFGSQTVERGLVVAPPRQVAVKVTDGRGKPIVGARIHVRVAMFSGTSTNRLTRSRSLHDWRPVGLTGAGGTASVVVADSVEPFESGASNTLLLASKPGYRASVSGWRRKPIVDGCLADEHENQVVSFALTPANAWTGQIVGRDGQPLAGRQVELTANQRIIASSSSSTWHAITFRARTDARGAFAFGQIPKRLFGASLFVSDGLPRSAAHRPAALLAPDREQPLMLDLRELVPVTLTVRDTSGSPARHARVLVVPLPVVERFLRAAPYQLRLDSGGQAVVPMQPGRWLVSVSDRVGYAAQVMMVSDPEQVPLSMQALRTVSGILRTKAGVSRADKKFRIESGRFHSGVGDHARALKVVADQWNDWFVSHVACNADGKFAVRYLPTERVRQSLTVWVGRKLHQVVLDEQTECVIDAR